MINPKLNKRLLLLSKDMYGSNFLYEPFLTNQSEGAMKGLPNKRRNADYINLIFALIKNECSFSEQFWTTYVFATIASTKLNSNLSIENICKLIEITQERFKKTKSEEDEVLLLELLNFISTNSLLANSSTYISSVNEPGMLAQQIIDPKYFEETIAQGRDLLMRAIFLIYGIPNSKTSLELSQPTKNELQSLKEIGLIENINLNYLIDEGDYALSQAERNHTQKEIDENDHLGFLVETKQELQIFRNRMAYVRVNSSGEYLPEFDALWEYENNRNKNKKNLINKLISKDNPTLTGYEAYEAIKGSIAHILECLEARESLSLWDDAIEINKLKIVAGLDNIRSIKNEITLGESILEPIANNPEKVTKESALKWLNDPKRRKAKFYSFLEFTTDASIENLKEIYETELSS